MLKMIHSFAKLTRAILFRPESFFCSLSVGRGFEFHIYECPGKWCSDEQLEKLAEDMRHIARAGQNGKPLPDYNVVRGTREDFAGKILGVAYDKRTGEPVGFSAQSYLDIETGKRREKVLHLGLIFVDPSVQGRNLTYLISILPNLVIFIKGGLRTVWVSNVTQVPAIIGMVAENFEDVFPTPNPKSRQSFDHRWLSEEILRRHRAVFGVGEEAEFDLDRQVIKNSYTGGSDHLKKTFADAPKHRTESYNEMCRRELNYDRGDDFIQLGRMDLRCYIECAKKKLEGSATRDLLLDLTFLGILGAILPPIRWLIPAQTNLRKI